MTTDLKQSIECTRKCLFASLNAIENEDNKVSIEEFVTNERLARPSFAFIHAVFRLYVLHPRRPFARGLYDESELDLKTLVTRKDKIRFIFKMLVCVATLTETRVDVMVSPVKILSGNDVSSTLFFMRYLARASRVECKVSNEAAEKVLKIGEGILYKESVKIRSSFIIFQAIARGRYTRRQLNKPSGDDKYISSKGRTKRKKSECLSHSTEVESYDAQAKLKSKEERHVDIQKNKATKSFSPKQPIEYVVVSKNTTKRKALFTQSTSNSTKVQISKFPERARREKSGCEFNKVQSARNDMDISLSEVRIRRGDGTCTDHISVHDRDMKTEKLLAVQMNSTFDNINDDAENTSPTPTKERRMKKMKIVNGVRTCQDFIVHEPLDSSNNNDGTKTKKQLSNIQELEEDTKRRLRRLKDKEERLNYCMKETKQKEEHLRAQEDRCKRLADNLRNQQERVKKDGIRQSIELDKLRLQMSKSGVVQKTVRRFEPTPSLQFSSDLLIQASTNATITDLRLALERRERALIKKHKRLSRAEHKLRSRMVEIEDIALRLNGGDSKVKNMKYEINNRLTRKVMKQKDEGLSEDENFLNVNVEPVQVRRPPLSTARSSQICLPVLPEHISGGKDNAYTEEETLNLANDHDEYISESPLEISIDASLETIKEDLEEKNDSEPRLVYRQHSMPRSLVDYTQHYETCSTHAALPRSKSY